MIVMFSILENRVLCENDNHFTSTCQQPISDTENGEASTARQIFTLHNNMSQAELAE
ncbi:MAG: hypothetical protein AAFO04_25290 [Cyanobacteria bacterium J06592_8]